MGECCLPVTPMRAARRGFLSTANWHSARHSLPPNTQTYIGQSSADLIAKVKSGEIVGAMIKGVPLDPEGELLTFPSTTITPQAVFFAPGSESESMQEAVDAALVRMLAAGKAQEARQNNPPNNCAQPKLTALAEPQRLIRAPRVLLRVDIEIHTCKSQEDHLDSFPFPPAADVLAGADSVLKDVLQTRVLKVTEYAGSAHSTGCEHECACGTDASLTPTCTGTATNTAATPDCAAAFAAAGDTLAASCPDGCTHFATPAWFPAGSTADCYTLGDSWDPATHCCACRPNSMTCTEGDNCEDPHAHSALPLCADLTYALDPRRPQGHRTATTRWLGGTPTAASPASGRSSQTAWLLSSKTSTVQVGAACLFSRRSIKESDVEARMCADIVHERVWCGWTCTQALLAGEAHMSAPYFLLDGFTFGRSRVSQMATSCTTMGGPNT